MMTTPRSLVIGGVLATSALIYPAMARAQATDKVMRDVEQAVRAQEAAVRAREAELRAQEAAMRLEIEENLKRLDDEVARFEWPRLDDVDMLLALQTKPVPEPPAPPRAPLPPTRNPNPNPFPTPIESPGFVYTGNLYEQARQSIDSGRYDRALTQLKQLIERYDNKPDAVANRVDAAMYWKAYTELKLSTLSESLKTLQDMQKKYGDSRWLKDAKALELEVRQASGQSVSPDMQSDDELKLLALRGLMQTDPDRAVPSIEQLLAGGSSVRVKENALFVLSQSRSPRAASIIGNAAKNSSNPDLQLKAVRYLGAMRTDESMKLLEELYRGSSDTEVKRAIIQSFSGSRAVDKLKVIVDTEKDIALRKTAIQTVGNMGRERSGELLRSMYASEQTVELKKEIIGALYRQQNATVLVALARAEKDPALKKQIVSNLSNMKSKEATDYMLELLK